MTQQEHAVERDHRRNRVQTIETGREIDYQKIQSAELSLPEDSMQRARVAEQRGRRDRWSDSDAIDLARLIIILIIILRKTDRGSFAAGKLRAGDHAQTMRSRSRLDSFDHREISTRLHPEHRGDARRIEVRIHDRDFFALERERRGDIYREHTFADTASRAGERNRRAYLGEIGTNPLAPIGGVDGQFACAIGLIVGKYPHQSIMSRR